MANGFTVIGDFYKPEVQAEFIQQYPLTSAALFSEGVIVRDPAIPVEGLSTNANTFFGPIDGPQRIVEDTELESAKIEAGVCIAPVQTDAIVKGIGDLTARAAKMADPVRALAEPFAKAWPSAFQNRALQIMVALAGATSFADNVVDISGETGDAAKLTDSTAVDIAGALGDHSEDLGVIVMHSAVRDALTKAKIILTQTFAGQQGQDRLQSGTLYLLNGRRVIADDRCPVDTGVYTTFFLGKNAFVYNEEALPAEKAFATERYESKHVQKLISRRFYVLHPRGVSYTGGFPVTDTLFQNSAKWARVWAAKSVPIVVAKHRI